MEAPPPIMPVKICNEQLAELGDLVHHLVLESAKLRAELDLSTNMVRLLVTGKVDRSSSAKTSSLSNK